MKPNASSGWLTDSESRLSIDWRSAGREGLARLTLLVDPPLEGTSRFPYLEEPATELERSRLKRDLRPPPDLEGVVEGTGRGRGATGGGAVREMAVGESRSQHYRLKASSVELTRDALTLGNGGSQGALGGFLGDRFLPDGVAKLVNPCADAAVRAGLSSGSHALPQGPGLHLDLFIDTKDVDE